MNRTSIALWLAAVAILAGALIVARTGTDRMAPRVVADHTEADVRRVQPHPSPGTNAPGTPRPAPDWMTYDETNQVDAPPGNPREQFDRLKPLAEAGDIAATMALYMVLSRCHDVQTMWPTPEQMEVDRRAGMAIDLVQMQKQAEQCDSIDRAAYDSRGRWLEIAAAAGHRQARLMYANDPTTIIGDESAMLRHPEKLVRYRQTALDYLAGMVAEGNITAMQSLASAYESGYLVDKDAVRSHAYYLVMHRVSPGIHLGNYLNLQRRMMSAGQVAEAERLSRDIHAKCCLKN